MNKLKEYCIAVKEFYKIGKEMNEKVWGKENMKWIRIYTILCIIAEILGFWTIKQLFKKEK